MTHMAMRKMFARSADGRFLDRINKIYMMRKEIMMMKIISVSCIALAFAGCMLCDATDEASSAMETRTFVYTPTIMDAMCISNDGQRYCDAHKPLKALEKTIAEDAHNWMEFFVKYQVSWPKGSRIRHDKVRHCLYITNTVENLDLIDCLWGMWETRHYVMIGLDVQIERNGEVLAKPYIVTHSGEEASFKNVTEYIYPTDYNVMVISNGCAVVEPESFTMREAGVMVRVTPTLLDDNIRVEVELDVTAVGNPEWKDFGETLIAPGGTKYSLKMEQPFFHMRSIGTKLTLVPGRTIVIGDDALRVTLTSRLIPAREVSRRDGGDQSQQQCQILESK